VQTVVNKQNLPTASHQQAPGDNRQPKPPNLRKAAGNAAAHSPLKLDDGRQVLIEVKRGGDDVWSLL